MKDFFENKLKNWDLDFCEDLQQTLNNLKSDDFFGTEGQLDPRGDFREVTELCEECDGNGCNDCDDGYIDTSEDMEEIHTGNIERVLKDILELEEHFINGIYKNLMENKTTMIIKKLEPFGVTVTMMPINAEQVVKEMYVAFRACASNKTIAQLIEEADNKTYSEKMKFLNGNFKHKHMAIAEFSHIAFALEGLPMYVGEQILRHRLLSFAKKSFRYTKIKDVDLQMFKKSDVDSPYVVKILEKYFYNPFEYGSLKQVRRDITNKQALISYLNELAQGILPEDARGSLGSGLRTTMMLSGNLRVFTDISPKRTCKRSQSLTNLIFCNIRDMILETIPELDDSMFNPSCNVCEDSCEFPYMR